MPEDNQQPPAWKEVEGTEQFAAFTPEKKAKVLQKWVDAVHEYGASTGSWDDVTEKHFSEFAVKKAESFYTPAPQTAQALADTGPKEKGKMVPIQSPLAAGIGEVGNALKNDAANIMASTGESTAGAIAGIARSAPDAVVSAVAQNLLGPAASVVGPVAGAVIGNSDSVQKAADLARPAANAVADYFSDLSDQMPSTFGVDPNREGKFDTNVAKGTGQMMSVVPTMAAGGASFPLMIAQMYGGGVEGEYQQNVKNGMPEDEALKKAELKSGATTLAMAPLYWGTGKAAKFLEEKIVSNAAPEIVKLISGVTANFGANAAASATIRAIEAGINGEDPIAAFKSVTLQGGMQDLMFAVHGQATQFKDIAAISKTKQAADAAKAAGATNTAKELETKMVEIQNTPNEQSPEPQQKPPAEPAEPPAPPVQEAVAVEGSGASSGVEAGSPVPAVAKPAEAAVPAAVEPAAPAAGEAGAKEVEATMDTLPRQLEIEKEHGLSSAESAVINLAIPKAQEAFAAGKYTTASEALQKEALRIGAPAGVDLTKISDLSITKAIMERYKSAPESAQGGSPVEQRDASKPEQNEVSTPDFGEGYSKWRGDIAKRFAPDASDVELSDLRLVLGEAISKENASPDLAEWQKPIIAARVAKEFLDGKRPEIEQAWTKKNIETEAAMFEANGRFENQPVSAAAVDAYGIKLPERYRLNAAKDLYIYENNDTRRTEGHGKERNQDVSGGRKKIGGGQVRKKLLLLESGETSGAPSPGGLSAEERAWGTKVYEPTPDGKFTVRLFHGTWRGGYDTFNEGTHFSKSEKYAANYMNPSASSMGISGIKEATKQMVYAADVTFKNIFDTRKPEARRIFQNEFLGKYGNGTELSERGLPDWTDSIELEEFLKEKHGDKFDGLVLDEGGVPSGDSVLLRPESYVPFSSKQIHIRPDSPAPSGGAELPLSDKTKTAEQVAEEKRKKDQADAIAEEQNRRLIAPEVEIQQDMLGKESDVPLFDQKPPEIEYGNSGTMRIVPPLQVYEGTPASSPVVKTRLIPGLDILKNAKDGILSLILPSAKSAEHLAAAEGLGARLGEKNRRQEIAKRQTDSDWKAFEKMGVSREDIPLPKNPGIKLMSDMSQGRPLTGKMEAFANKVAKMFQDRLALLDEAGVGLQTVREHYFPGMWQKESRMAFNLAMEQAKKDGIINDSFNVNNATAEQKAWIKERVDAALKDGVGSETDALPYLTKRPMEGKESFRKQKVFDDIMTATEFGLRPISNNPVDIVRLKLAEMDQNILANQYFNDLKAKDQLRIIDPYADVPDGWVKVPDKYGIIHGAPTVKMDEYVDKAVYDGLMKVSQGLGITPERLMNAGRGRLGFASTSGRTVSQYATELSVLAHELGHQLDFKYGLWDRITGGESPSARTPVAKELRALTDLYFEGQTPSKSFKRKIRKSEEKMARMLEAYIHAPEKFKQVAPTVFKRFDSFIKSNKETKGLADIKPGISLEHLSNEKYVGLPILGYRIVPAPTGEILTNYLSSSLYNNQYFGGVYKAWMGTANAINQGQLGGGSQFHTGFTTGEVQVSAGANLIKDIYGVLRGNRTPKQLLDTAVKYPASILRTGIEGDKVLNAWRNPDGQIEPRIANVVRGLELGGFQFEMAAGLRTEQTAQVYRDWYSGHKIKAAMRSPIAATELLMKPVMSFIVPRQKGGVAADLIHRIIEQNPNKSLEELTPQFRQAVNRVDARLGQVGYERLFMNNTAKNIVQGTIRAPGWSGGTIAEIGGAFKDAAGFFSEWAKTGKLPQDIPDRTAYAISLVATTTAINGALTYAFTGTAPTGLDFIAFRSGKKDDQGRPERMFLPTYMKDVMSYWIAPGQTLLDKAHPLINIFGQLAANKDYYGVEISDPQANLIVRMAQDSKFVAKSFMPFWIRGAQKEIDRGGSASSVVAPFFGVMPAPRKVIDTPAVRLASTYANQMKSQLPKTEQQEEKRLERSKAVQLLRSGDESGLQKGLESGSIKPSSVSMIRKLASSTELQNNVRRLPLEQAERVFEKATEEEKREIMEIMEKKRNPDVKSSSRGGPSRSASRSRGTRSTRR